MSDPLSRESLTLGATYLPEWKGTRFALYCGAPVEAVSLCLFASPEDGKPSVEHNLTHTVEGFIPGAPGKVWCGFIEGVGPEQLYGYRVCGEWKPKEGLRYNRNKLVLDPYGKLIGRQLRWDPALFSHVKESANDLEPDPRDSAPFAPLAAVYPESEFDWEGDRPLRIPWDKSGTGDEGYYLIYEAHVKGQTILHPGVPFEFRGTYEGFGSKANLRHLRRLGVTAVELMPVHKAPPHGASYKNYWGYDSIAFHAPNRDFSAFRRGVATSNELKRMIKRLHRNEIEVILDVVFNHTAEGNHHGPTFSLKGIDNGGYYKLCGKPDEGEYRYYVNHSGTGNTLNMKSPAALHLVISALEWWVREYHIDGFRFDLAALLMDQEFLEAVAASEVLGDVKLIAEPWDANGTMALGRFPPNWKEWNHCYRDTVRRMIRGDRGQRNLFATRIAGSRDLFPLDVRGQSASVNFVTCHDGFTLDDLVSYESKHNEANGEGNRDGHNDNCSANYGCEGPTTDARILELRRRQKRNLIATLAFSSGTPMVLAGDEIGRTQLGNNNAYCHDNALTWLDWENQDRELLDFFRKVFKLRRQYSALHSVRRDGSAKDKAHVLWFKTDGTPLVDAREWEDPEARELGVWLLSHEGSTGRHCPLVLLFNMHWERKSEFQFPQIEQFGNNWKRLLDTSLENPFEPVNISGKYMAEARSVCLFRLA